MINLEPLYELARSLVARWDEAGNTGRVEAPIVFARMRGIFVEELRDALAAKEQVLAGQEAAAHWQAFERLLKVDGASWGVTHPRVEGAPYYLGFSLPMSQKEVLAAIQLESFGWTPGLQQALADAAAVVEARNQPSTVAPTAAP